MTIALDWGLLRRILVLAVIAFHCMARAQVPAKNPSFEVSTVRPSGSDTRGSNLNLEMDSIRSSNLPVMFLLKFAFNLNGGSDDQIIGAPKWVSSVPFDIRAKVDEEAAATMAKMPTDERMETTRRMVQMLLEDRFQLKIHHENRELPVLALTAAKGGSKLTPVNDTSATSVSGESGWTGLHNPGPGETEGRDVPIAVLVSALSSKPEIGGRLVVDETGLIGKYSFKLTWAPTDAQGATDAGAGGPTLFTAIEEQLGLKLQTQKAPVDCVVIDQ